MAPGPKAGAGHQRIESIEMDLTMDASSSTCSEQDNAPPKDARFWMIIFSISLSSFLSALDTSILAPALPTVAAALHSRELYVWAVNAFLIACTITSLLCAHIADLFGRKFVMIGSMMLFAIGSALCGAAPSTAVLILGRVVQGIGSGGILTMSSLIMCDIVPMRERSLYSGLIQIAWTVATVVGPSVGGALTEKASWRWMFWINLPASAIAIAIAFKFLRVQHPYQGTVRQRLARIDWYGGLLLTGSISSALLALSWAGSQYQWSSWPVLVPLLLGSLGAIGFVVFEARKKDSDHAVMPVRIFSNRTSATIFALTLLQAMLLYWLVYFAGIYSQGVLEASPLRAAVLGLPTCILAAPAGIFAGWIVAKTGHYRLFHFAGFGLLLIGFGLFLILDADSPISFFIVFQVPLALGFGILASTCLPAALASLADDDSAVVVGFATSTRNFGYMWGVAIAAAVFEERIESLSGSISNTILREALLHGQAYSNASKAFLDSLKGTPEVLAEAKDVYVLSLRRVWQVALAPAAVALLLCFLVRSLPLRTTLHTKYGVVSDRELNTSGTESTEN